MKMLERLDYRIEVPISRKTARERGLPGNIAMLQLYSISDIDSMSPTAAKDLSQCVARWTQPDEAIYTCPLMPYISDRRLRKVLETYGLSQYTERVDHDYLIQCASKKALASILQYCSSEITVVIISKTKEAVRQTLVFAAEYKGPFESFEALFIKRLNVHDGFIFFAEGHASLEVFGTEDFVVRRCLQELFKEPRRSSNQLDGGTV